MKFRQYGRGRTAYFRARRMTLPIPTRTTALNGELRIWSPRLLLRAHCRMCLTRSYSGRRFRENETQQLHDG